MSLGVAHLSSESALARQHGVHQLVSRVEDRNGSPSPSEVRSGRRIRRAQAPFGVPRSLLADGTTRQPGRLRRAATEGL
jgi:hypothetical protein